MYGMWGVMEIVEGVGGKRKAPHIGQYLPIEVVHDPILLYGVLMEGGVANVVRGLVIKPCCLS